MDAATMNGLIALTNSLTLVAFVAGVLGGMVGYGIHRLISVICNGKPGPKYRAYLMAVKRQRAAYRG